MAKSPDGLMSGVAKWLGGNTQCGQMSFSPLMAKCCDDQILRWPNVVMAISCDGQKL